VILPVATAIESCDSESNHARMCINANVVGFSTAVSDGNPRSDQSTTTNDISAIAGLLVCLQFHRMGITHVPASLETFVLVHASHDRCSQATCKSGHIALVAEARSRVMT
jgi:hypothetical protein